MGLRGAEGTGEGFVFTRGRERKVVGRGQQCQGWEDSWIQSACGTAGKWKSGVRKEIKEEAQESQQQWGGRRSIFLVTTDHRGKCPGAQRLGVSSPAPAAIHPLQVLVPERACPLCYCPRLLPCYFPLRCCGAGFGGLEDLHSAQCHSGQRTGADLEVGPHCTGPLQSGGHDLGAGCSHPDRLVYRLRLHPLKLSAR